MMRATLLIAFVCAITTTMAHPGTGIVKNSKGFIFYTDLANIYRLNPKTGEKTIVLRGIHSHELFMDKNDILYGEHLWLKEEATNRFDHYLWSFDSFGKFDTIAGPSQAYMRGFDFSICRDNNGNEYRVQALTTDYILKKTKDGKVTTIASGNFKDVAWLQPFDDGSVYYTQNNMLFRITHKDSIERVAQDLSPTGSSWPGVYGIWRGPTPGALYIAVASDGAVKKINSDGRMFSIFFEKETHWFPTGGVFDNEDRLWVLEFSKSNEVRVISPIVNENGEPVTANSDVRLLRQMFFAPPYGWIILIALLLAFFFFRLRKKYEK